MQKLYVGRHNIGQLRRKKHEFFLQTVVAVFIMIIYVLPVHAEVPRGIRLDGTVGGAGKLDLVGTGL